MKIIYKERALDDMSYAAYIMDHGNNNDWVICNGDTLLDAMEEGYLFNEYLESLNDQFKNDLPSHV